MILLHKQKFKFFLYSFFALFLLFSLLLYPDAVKTSVANSLSLCGKVLIPALFPFLVLSSFLIEYKTAEKIGGFFDFLMRPLFNLPGSCAPAFLLGLLCGYPVGAKTAIALYDKGLCTKSEAERLCAFSNNASPAFMISAVGAALFGSAKLGAALYICHILASVSVGIFFGKAAKHNEAPRGKTKKTAFQYTSFASSLAKAVQGGAATIFSICAFVVFFGCASALLGAAGITDFLANLISAASFFNISQEFATAFLNGILEMTSGISALSLFGNSTLPAVAALCGFSGFAIHFQVISFLSGTGISPRLYLSGKLLHGAFAALLTFVYMKIFAADIPAFATHIANLSAKISFMPALFSAVLFSIMFLFLVRYRRKIN